MEGVAAHERPAPVAVMRRAAQKGLQHPYGAVARPGKAHVRRQAAAADRRQTGAGGQLDRLLGAEQARHLPTGPEVVHHRVAVRRDVGTGQQIVDEHQQAPGRSTCATWSKKAFAGAAWTNDSMA